MAEPTITYRFFENGDKYGQANFASLIRSLLTSGYLPQFGNKLVVSANTSLPRTVSIATGMAVLNGYILELENAPYNLTLDAPHSSLKRIDRIVARVTTNTATRGIAFAVLKGTPSSEPTEPSLTQTSSVWELPLARVAMNPGTAMIPASAVTDERVPSYNNPTGLSNASKTAYGGVKIGSGINVSNGVISVSTPFPMRARMTLTNSGLGILIDSNTYLSTIGYEPIGVIISNKGTLSKSITYMVEIENRDNVSVNATVTYHAKNVFTTETRDIFSETKKISGKGIVYFSYSTTILCDEIGYVTHSFDVTWAQSYQSVTYVEDSVYLESDT